MAINSSRTIVPRPSTVHFNNRAGILTKVAKHLLLRQLAMITQGKLTLVDQSEIHVFGSTDKFKVSTTINVHDQGFYRDIVFNGSVGAGESYIRGHWTTDNLTAVIRIFSCNYKVLEQVESGLASMSFAALKVWHWFNRNTLQGSKRNIVAHYDLGNELFELFLDPTMMYSAGIFYSEKDSMQQASFNKLDRICKKLQISSDDHVLEIGTGWGGFAIHAARHYGCKVTTTTISEEQYSYAKQRIESAGVADKVTLLKLDYRKLTGKYDKLVSIEMIEAVGHQYYPEFFRVCNALLKDNGIMLLQAITINDQRYESARNSVDFIQKYIFPGSCIPSVTALSNAATRASELKLFHLEDFGEHYARTLRNWRKTFFKNAVAVRRLGYNNEFIRMWDFYLSYCEGGFQERLINDVHLIFTKPLCRAQYILPRLE